MILQYIITMLFDEIVNTKEAVTVIVNLVYYTMERCKVLVPNYDGTIDRERAHVLRDMRLLRAHTMKQFTTKC